MKRIIPIEGPYRLKAVVQSDAITIFNIIQRERSYLSDWLPFIQFSKHVQDTKSFIAHAILQRNAGKDFLYKICEVDKLIGLIGTKDTDYFNKHTELGYWISQEYQSKGITTKANYSLIKELFEDLKMERIQICCAVGNEKSIAIPNKLGFTFEGIRRNGEWVSENKYRDLKIFSLLKVEFNTQQ
ncbi:GNAT family N-acetyltransferase [Sphingobacterium sp. HJSM2_6]|uniref:GNAT family N-acetyltransferase n=1 Tax=Sphingobacterium sp. HJSM2_6 TaxID=3366264 RepID=UPI003BE248C1